MAVIKLHDHKFQATPNPNADRSSLQHVLEYHKTANGAFKVLQFLEKVSKAAMMILKEMGDNMASFFGELAGKFGHAAGMLTIPRLLDVTKKAWDALTNWGAVEGIEGTRLQANARDIHEVAEATSAWGYAISLIFGNVMVFGNATTTVTVKDIADGASLVGDSTDLGLAGGTYAMAGTYIAAIDKLDLNKANNADLRERFVDTQREALLRLAKCALAVASAVLGYIAISTGEPLVSAAAMLVMSIAGTILSIGGHYFKETRPYELVKFFEDTKNVVKGNKIY